MNAVCLFACAAGLLYILLTGIKVFWSSGAEMRREEGSGVNRRVERAVRWFTMAPFHILPHLRFFFYSWQDCPGYFILLGAGENVTTYLIACISQSGGHVVWLLSLMDRPTHQQVGHSTSPIKAFHKHLLALMDSHYRPHTHQRGPGRVAERN